MPSASLVLASAYLNHIGRTVTVNVTGNSGNLSPGSGIAGFTATLDGVSNPITAATSSGSVVTLTLTNAPTPGQILKISYAPGTLVDGSSNTMPSTSNFVVTYLYFSAAAFDVTKSRIIVTLAGIVTAPVLPASAGTGWTVTYDGVSQTISSAVGSGSTMLLTMAAAPVDGQVVQVAYSTGNATDSHVGTANVLVDFTANAVTPYRNAISTAMQTAFAADGVVAQMAAGKFGNVVPTLGDGYRVYLPNNVDVLCVVHGILDLNGVLTISRWYRP